MPSRTCGASCLALLLAAAPWAAAGEGKPGGEAPAKASPPYATAHAAALDARELVDLEADDHTRFRVEFNGIKGDRVPAYLYVPKRKGGAAPPWPAVLLQYGTGGNKKTDYIVAVGKQFVARGFVVLTIDAPGQGERRGKAENKAAEILGVLGGTKTMHYCGDYSRAMDFLCTRPEVDRERLGYVGISWGGITGIVYVAHEPRVRAMTVLVAGGNFVGAWTPEAAAKVARGGFKSGDPVFHVGRIAPRPLLLINVTKDQLIPRVWADALHRAAGDGAKVVWLETDHYLRGMDRAVVCDSVIDFMGNALPAAARPREK